MYDLLACHYTCPATATVLPLRLCHALVCSHSFVSPLPTLPLTPLSLPCLHPLPPRSQTSPGHHECITNECLTSTLSTSESVAAATNKDWQYYVGSFFKQHSQQLFHSFDIAAVIDREKHRVTFKYFRDDTHSSFYCIGLCSLSTSMHTISLKSSVFPIGAC